MIRVFKIYILVFTLWTSHGLQAFDDVGVRQQSLYKAYRMRSNLDHLIANPQEHDKIVGALKDVKENWEDVKYTRLGKDVLGKAIKLKKMKLILDGFNKCLGDGKNEKKFASSILKVIESIPADEFVKKSNCLEGVISELAVVDENQVLGVYAPVNYMYKRQQEKDYREMVNTRFEKLLDKDSQDEVMALTEKIETIDDEVIDKEKIKQKAKKELRDKLYKKVREQMVHIHGMFNYLLEDGDSRSEKSKIEESLSKSCPGCSKEEVAKHREALVKSIEALKKNGVRPVNTERFRNRVQNNMIGLAKTVYKIDERRIYGEDGEIVKRTSSNQDLSENRINYKFNPGSNISSDVSEVSERQMRFYAKRRELMTTEYGQLAKLGIVPNMAHIGLQTKKETHANGEITYRTTFQNCPSEDKCTDLFEEEPVSPFQLGRKLGETFGMKDFDLKKFKKERLGSIEDAMGKFKKMYDEGSLDDLLDKLIMNNPVTAGELLAEDPEQYLQLMCERIKVIGKDKDFDDNLKSAYLNITAALIIGGFVFMGPIGAAPLAGKVLLGSWYAMTGVSAYFGVKAYQNEDFAKASCYSGTGNKQNCDQIDEYYTDKKYAILFGVMVPGSDLLRIADVAIKAAGPTFSVKRVFDTGSTIRGRVLTFKSQGESLVEEATHYHVESSIKAILNLNEEELGQLPEAERKEIVAIIQEVYDKGGNRGVESLVLAIRTIKDLEAEGQKVEKELSGMVLLKEARRLQHHYDSK